MEQLVAENVYRRVHMYDYQGVCFMGEKQDNSRSNYLLNVSRISASNYHNESLKINWKNSFIYTQQAKLGLNTLNSTLRVPTLGPWLFCLTMGRTSLNSAKKLARYCWSPLNSALWRGILKWFVFLYSEYLFNFQIKEWLK